MKFDIPNLPLLTKLEEQQLINVVQTSNNIVEINKAIVTLVNRNLKLVMKLAKQYEIVSNITLDDLYSVGRIGLITSIHKYNTKYNTRFATYATYWIKREILNVIAENNVVKIPSHVVQGSYQVRKLIKCNKNISKSEIRKRLNLTKNQMRVIEQAKISSISMNQEVKNGHNDTEHTTIGDFLSTDVIEKNNCRDPRFEFMVKAFDELDETSQYILKHNVYSPNKLTLKTLGEQFGISGEMIRQIRCKALRTLRKKIKCQMALVN